MGDIDQEREEYIERSKKVNIGPMGDYTTSTYAVAGGFGRHGATCGPPRGHLGVSPIPLSALVAIVIGVGLILGVVIAIFS